MDKSDPPMGFEQFCRTAWPDRFTVPFAREEVGAVASVIDLRTAARAVMTGGLHAVVLERGKGKTTLSAALVIWMTHEGLRRFPVMLCRDEAAAQSARVLIEAMLVPVQAKWHRTIAVHPPLAIQANLAGITRPGVRDKVERPDFALIDDPLQDGADDAQFERMLNTLTTTIPAMAGSGRTTSALLLGDLGICRALQARGWAGS
jgi:hypothetical protein